MDRKHNKSLVYNARILRKNMTKEERHLWYDFLRDYPIKIVRQKILGKYIVDFYCAKAKMVIELDGSQHYTDNGKSSDDERTEYIKKFGIRVIRIPNNYVKENFRGVCEYLDLKIKQSLNQLC